MFLLIHVTWQRISFEIIYRREGILGNSALPCIEVMQEHVHNQLSQVSWCGAPGKIDEVWLGSWDSTWAALLRTAMDTTQAQVSAKWLQPKFFGSNVHELKKKNMSGGLDPAAFFCRALTNVDDNFLPVLSSEELKSESKWCSAFELLDHFFASTWTGSGTEGTKCSSPCSTSWQWTWNKLMAALTKKMKSERKTGKTIFSSFRLPTRWAKRVRRGDTSNRCCLLHPTEMCFVFSSYSWWGWNSCSLSLRGEKKVQEIRYIVRIKIVSEKEWKFKKKNGRVNVIGANGRQWEV